MKSYGSFFVREMNIFINKIRSSYSHGTLWRPKHILHGTIHSFSRTKISFDGLVCGPSDKPKYATPTTIPSTLCFQLFDVLNSQVSTQQRHLNGNNSHAYKFEQAF